LILRDFLYVEWQLSRIASFVGVNESENAASYPLTILNIHEPGVEMLHFVLQMRVDIAIAKTLGS
jgi:hypothetical protein